MDKTEFKAKWNKNDLPAKDDTCGLICELYSSDNLSISHVKVTATSKKHKHKELEEIYYVTKGSGELHLGEKILKIQEGDVIPIPKNTYHEVRTLEDKPLEILVVTHPRFTLEDVHL